MASLYHQEKLSKNKFFYDSRIDFELESRAAKLFGLWAVRKLGLVGENAEEYARKVLDINIQAAGFDDIISKIADDLGANKINFSKHLLEIEMEKALSIARAKKDYPALLDSQ
jgi:hypothetical protein